MTKVTVKSPDLLLGKIEQALAEIGQKSCTVEIYNEVPYTCILYTSPSPRD